MHARRELDRCLAPAGSCATATRVQAARFAHDREPEARARRTDIHKRNKRTWSPMSTGRVCMASLVARTAAALQRTVRRRNVPSVSVPTSVHSTGLRQSSLHVILAIIATEHNIPCGVLARTACVALVFAHRDARPPCSPQRHQQTSRSDLMSCNIGATLSDRNTLHYTHIHASRTRHARGAQQAHVAVSGHSQQPPAGGVPWLSTPLARLMDAT